MDTNYYQIRAPQFHCLSTETQTKPTELHVVRTKNLKAESSLPETKKNKQTKKPPKTKAPKLAVAGLLQQTPSLSVRIPQKLRNTAFFYLPNSSAIPE